MDLNRHFQGQTQSLRQTVSHLSPPEQRLLRDRRMPRQVPMPQRHLENQPQHADRHRQDLGAVMVGDKTEGEFLPHALGPHFCGFRPKDLRIRREVQQRPPGYPGNRSHEELDQDLKSQRGGS